MKIIKRVGLIALIASLAILSFSLYEYFSWKKNFVSSKEDMVCTDFSRESDLTNVQKRVKDYVFSKDGTATISFSVKEVLAFLKYVPVTSNTITVKEMCVKPSKGVWLISLKLKVYGTSIPWVQFNLVKDARETAQLYVKDFSFGGISLLNIFSSKVMNEVNEGISESIVLVNENGFLGRDIHNIELLEEMVVVR